MLLRTFALLVIAFSISACGGGHHQQLAAVVSPDHKIVAVLTEHSGPLATGSVGYHLTVGVAGNPKSAIAILDVDHTRAPRMLWTKPDTLEVEVPCGDITHFSNFAEISGQNSDWTKVRVLLKNDGSCDAV